MTPFRVLVAALYLQVLLGLARFALPYLGIWLDDRLWLIHPVNGIAITVAAIVLFRPRGEPLATPVRVAARFAPLLALALGLGMASAQDLIGAPWAVLLHMATGVAAVRVIGTAMAQQGAAPGARPVAGGAEREGAAS
jgi:hypothetical protein